MGGREIVIALLAGAANRRRGGRRSVLALRTGRMAEVVRESRRERTARAVARVLFPKLTQSRNSLMAGVRRQQLALFQQELGNYNNLAMQGADDLEEELGNLQQQNRNGLAILLSARKEDVLRLQEALQRGTDLVGAEISALEKEQGGQDGGGAGPPPPTPWAATDEGPRE